jgi:hypothetical protein
LQWFSSVFSYVLLVFQMHVSCVSFVLSRDENGQIFSRTIPFCFLHFPVCFRICEILFSYLRK